MSNSERLSALKKVYADVILNTGKEAAAKIMVSERKAFRYQRELAETKQEALRMLMRFKQMLDAKDNEAQMTYINKQRKIDELEAQLQEAEDIVKDLREELREVRAELEWVSCNQQQLRNERNLKTESAAGEGVLEDDGLKSNGWMDSSCCRNSCQCGTGSRADGSYITNPELAAKSMKNEELQLYNCDKKMHGSEGNPRNGKFTISGNIEDAYTDSPDRKHIEPKGKSVQPTTGSERVCKVEENQREYKIIQADSSPEDVWAVKSMSRKRKRLDRKNSEAVQVDFCIEEIPMKSSCKKTAAFTDYQASSRVSVESSNQSNESSSQINGNEPLIDSKKPTISKKPTVSESLSSTTDTDSFPGYTEVSESDAEIVKDSSASDSLNPDKISKLDLVRLENGSAGNQETPACKADTDTVDLSLVESVPQGSNLTNAVQNQNVAKRIIKYTFHRRQKKGCLGSSDDSSSIRKCNSKKAGHKQNGNLEPQKSTLHTESTRERRRVAQVAHQLLSLSQNKRR